MPVANKNLLRLPGLLMIPFMVSATLLSSASLAQEQTAESAKKPDTQALKTENKIEESTESKESRESRDARESKESKDSKEPRVSAWSSSAEPATLTIAGEEIFVIRAQLGPFTPERRVETIKKNAQQVENDHAAVEQMTVKEDLYSSDVVAGKTTILSITDIDAKLDKSESRRELALKVSERLKRALLKDIKEHSFSTFLLAAARTAGVTILLFLLLGATGWLFPKLYAMVEQARGTLIKPIKIQKTELLSQDTLSDLTVGMVRVVRVLFVMFLFSLYIPTVLSFFPDTRQLSGQLITYSVQPFREIFIPAILSYLPNIAFIIAALIGTYYFLALTHFAYKEIGRGNITISGFDPEWSESTYKIARFLIIAFMFVMIYPYLPGSGSPAFQQVSIFIGILVSLGSTGSIAHVIAGVFLTYTGAFKIGDRVKIADTVGDVVEKTLLATRVRTIKQEYITIPNGLVLGSHIINYSSSVGNPGLILHTAVSIGYSVPWKQVHELLIDAALKTENLRSDPAPFVLQTALDDFYVSYQINAYTDVPSAMAVTYSSLHQNIQDVFSAAGVEIMSPHYRAVRDGNAVALPTSHPSKD